MNIIKNDEHVTDLKHYQLDQIQRVSDFYGCYEDVYLFETIHGHVVKMAIVLSHPLAPHAYRLDKEDFKFLADIDPRWIEINSHEITIGV